MTPDPTGGGIGHVRFPGEAEAERGTDRLTDGVPMSRIVRPLLRPAPELVVLVHPRGPDAARFHRLRATLEALRPEPPAAIVVTSASHGEGRSIVAANLALAYAAERPGEVLLVGADLRRPSLGRRLDPPPKLGLTELLGGRTDPDHVLLELRNTPLHFLAAGTSPGDPLGLLVSERCEQIMAELKRRYRILVFDTPPIVPYTDADLVARFADGVLVVARSGLTRRGSLSRAIASVTAAPVLGTVINDV